MIAEYKCPHCKNKMMVFWTSGNPLATVRCDSCGLYGQRVGGKTLFFRLRAWLVNILETTRNFMREVYGDV